MLRLLMVPFILMLASTALAGDGAETYKEPTASQLQQAAQARDAALQGMSDPSVNARINQDISKAKVQMDALPAELPTTRLDLPAGEDHQSWADRFNEVESDTAKANRLPAKQNMAPLIFASLSMPRELLKQYAADAQRVGGTVVFIGLKDDSFTDMRRELVQIGDGFAIDPTLFSRFGITTVPTVVLPLEPIAPCDANSCAPVNHVQVSGDLPLGDALDFIHTNSREPGAAALADTLLKKLRDE